MYRLRYKILTFSLLIIFTNANCKVITLPEDLQQANVSYLVTDVVSGKEIASYAPHRCATPASITKLVTTATALETLGADYRFKTSIAYDGTLKNGILRGNLYVIGGGDPSLGSIHVKDTHFIDQWCQQIKDLGITRITGNIVADASVYEREAVPTRWLWEDMGNYYGAGVYGLSVYDNTLSIQMRSGTTDTQPTILNITPQISDLQIYNKLTTSNTKTDSAYVYGMPYDNRRWIFGTIPAKRNQFIVKGDIPNPPLCVVEQLCTRLRDFGIIVNGTFTDKVEKHDDYKTLFVHESKPLSELIRITNFYSNNNYAEHILRQMDRHDNATATNSGALNVERQFWEHEGLDFTGIMLNDGSGLSPMNAFSADFLNNILRYMYHSSNYKAFLASLPIVGKEGTVKSFMKATPGVEIRAKSGSMSGVQSYAGYIVKGDKTYSFVVIINHFGSRQSARQDIRNWLNEIIKKM